MKLAKFESYTIDINDYQCIGLLNSGAFGDVYLVENKTDHRQYAAKVNKKRSTSTNSLSLSRELGLLIRVQAPTIIRFYGFSSTDFEDKPRATIIMKYYEKVHLNNF